MALAASGYVWGELIAPRLLATLLQAAVLVVGIRIVRGAARSAGAALGVGQLLSGDGTTAPEVSPSTALWHMRSAGRLIYGLCHKKNTPLDCESQ